MKDKKKTDNGEKTENNGINSVDNGFNIRKGNLDNLPQIHPKFAELMPPDEEAYKALETSILINKRIDVPIATCIIDGIEYVLDGHMRLDVALKNGINDFQIQTLPSINSVEEGMVCIILNACSHRQLNKAQKVKLVLKLKPCLDAIAKSNQKLGGQIKSVFDKLANGSKSVTVAKELAKMAGVSPDFVIDAVYVFENGTAEEKKELLDKGTGASPIRKRIEQRQTAEPSNITINPYINPNEGEFVNQIINGNCLDVLQKMYLSSIRNIAALVTSCNYNVGVDYGPNFDDKIDRKEYLHNIGMSMYLTSLCGREGMKFCVNCCDTSNTEANMNGGHYEFDISKDLGNQVDLLNKQYKDCNLRFIGKFIWAKNQSSAIPFMGSYDAPVIKSDAEYIMVWVKGTRKLTNTSGINCKPGSGSIFSDSERDKYIITKDEFMKWTYQTWNIPPCKDKNLLAQHPCPFPEELPHRLIKLFTKPGDIVIDPFAGLATTCLAAKKLSRNYIGIDQNSNYCNAAKKRIDSYNNDNVVARKGA